MLTYHMTKLYLNIKSITSFNFWNSSLLTISQICYMFIPWAYISYISSWTLSICRAEFLSLHFCMCTNPSLVKLLSRVWLFATLWTVAHQAPPSIECSRQEYWSGLPFPSPGDLPNPGIEPGSPALWADTSLSEPPGNPSLGMPNFSSSFHLFVSTKNCSESKFFFLTHDSTIVYH